MTPLEIFVLPGRQILELFFHAYIRDIDPNLITVIAGFISWVIWTAAIRATWEVTLRLFGFAPRGHR